jgi:type I restriction enzyme S subunit
MIRELAIEEFCLTGSGGTPSRARAERYYANGTVPWVKSGELREETIFATEEHITEAAIEESAAKLVPAGALLVAMYGATVGRVGRLGIAAATNQAVCYVIPDRTRADPEYVFHALKAKVPEWLGKRVGGAQPNISQGIVRETRVYLPPLPEQKRIAAILDKADAIKRKRQEAIRLTEELLRAAFLEMFGDPVTNPKGWPVRKLGEVGLAEIQGGLQTSHRRTPNPIEVPYLRVANVYRDSLHLEEIKTLRVTADELARVHLVAGDVLIVEGHGNPTEIGRAAVWTGEVRDCVHQNHLIRVRVSNNVLLSGYLSAFINSDAGRRQMQRFGKTTSGLNTISVKNVKAIELPVPPMERQQEFKELLGLRQSTIASQSQHEKSVDEMVVVLTRQAFSGRL